MILINPILKRRKQSKVFGRMESNKISFLKILISFHYLCTSYYCKKSIADHTEILQISCLFLLYPPFFKCRKGISILFRINFLGQKRFMAGICLTIFQPKRSLKCVCYRVSRKLRSYSFFHLLFCFLYLLLFMRKSASKTL